MLKPSTTASADRHSGAKIRRRPRLKTFWFEERSNELVDLTASFTLRATLFGTADDASDRPGGLRYTTERGLPWGMVFIDTFDYPVERTSIAEAYPKFVAWVTSGGVDYPDWYVAGAGQREEALVY